VPYGGTAWQGQAWKGPVATRPGPDYGNGWGNGQRSCGPGVFAPLMGLVWLFVILGSVILFGGFGGGGRPLAIVLFLAALALVRRLIGMGRRRGYPLRVPRRAGSTYRGRVRQPAWRIQEADDKAI